MVEIRSRFERRLMANSRFFYLPAATKRELGFGLVRFAGFSLWRAESKSLEKSCPIFERLVAVSHGKQPLFEPDLTDPGAWQELLDQTNLRAEHGFLDFEDDSVVEYLVYHANFERRDGERWWEDYFSAARGRLVVYVNHWTASRVRKLRRRIEDYIRKEPRGETVRLAGLLHLV